MSTELTSDNSLHRHHHHHHHQELLWRPSTGAQERLTIQIKNKKTCVEKELRNIQLINQSINQFISEMHE